MIGIGLQGVAGTSGWVGEGHVVVGEPSDAVVASAAINRAVQRKAVAQASDQRTAAIEAALRRTEALALSAAAPPEPEPDPEPDPELAPPAKEQPAPPAHLVRVFVCVWRHRWRTCWPSPTAAC